MTSPLRSRTSTRSPVGNEMGDIMCEFSGERLSAVDTVLWKWAKDERFLVEYDDHLRSG